MPCGDPNLKPSFLGCCKEPPGCRYKGIPGVGADAPPLVPGLVATRQVYAQWHRPRLFTSGRQYRTDIIENGVIPSKRTYWRKFHSGNVKRGFVHLAGEPPFDGELRVPGGADFEVNKYTNAGAMTDLEDFLDHYLEVVVTLDESQQEASRRYIMHQNPGVYSEPLGTDDFTQEWELLRGTAFGALESLRRPASPVEDEDINGRGFMFNEAGQIRGYDFLETALRVPCHVAMTAYNFVGLRAPPPAPFDFGDAVWYFFALRSEFLNENETTVRVCIRHWRLVENEDGSREEREVGCRLESVQPGRLLQLDPPVPAQRFTMDQHDVTGGGGPTVVEWYEVDARCRGNCGHSEPP